ncbi:MAG: hypothetical protein IH597_03250 [Bacteroidales bacterium]|nr:hypothetical protein [Bacteroidales bacterium]
MRKQVVIFIILAIFIIPTQLIGQYTVKYNFHPHDPDSCIVSFVDTVKNEVVRSFTLVEYSPYWNLPYQEVKPEGLGKRKVFNLQSVEFPEKEALGLFSYDLSPDCFLKSGRTYSTLELSQNNQYIIVIHYLNLFSDNRRLGHAAILNIYNAKGELIRTIKSSDTEILQPCITNNGKYFGYVYGTGLNEDETEMSKTGYRIINVQNDEIVIDREVQGQGMMEIAAVNNKFITSYLTLEDYQKRTFIVVMPENRIQFSKTFSRNELDKFKEVTDEGLLIGNDSRNDTNTYLLRFDPDFDREELE